MTADADPERAGPSSELGSAPTEVAGRPAGGDPGSLPPPDGSGRYGRYQLLGGALTITVEGADLQAKEQAAAALARDLEPRR